MRTLILGTAGHVDHGKTTLVRALTGTDTDRLDEEHRRGISIELGFAHLDLGEGLRLGIVDVPGHERFVRQMVAGAGGMDLAMLLVAADEGVMPQTREHFDVLRMLAVPSGLVVLTKIDMADSDLADVVEEEVHDLVEGSFLEGAPVVRVSGTTGAGLDELKAQLVELAGAAPTRSRDADFRLPLDRVFALPGTGVVVAGTAWSGTVRAGDNLRLLPQDRELRVREVQSHGSSAEQAGAGERVAISLAQIKQDELTRGDQLVGGSAWAPATIVGVRITAVDDPILASRMRPRAAIHVHHAAREVEARLDLLDRDAGLEAGGTALARLLLDEPLIAAPGDRLVLRTWSPMITAAGGIVVEPQGRSGERRAETLRRLRVLEEGSRDSWAFADDLPPRSGWPKDELLARLHLSGFDDDRIAARVEDGRAIQIGERVFARVGLDDLVERAFALLRAHQSGSPMSLGLGTAELRRALGFDAPAALFAKVLNWASGEHPVFVNGDRVRADTATPELDPTAAEGLGEMENRVRDAEPMFEATDADLKDPALRLLVDQGRVVKLDRRLFAHEDKLEELRQQVSEHFDSNDTLELKSLKEWTGASRKFVVPLAEWLDRAEVTRNDGGVRRPGPRA
jgi:selenocysteine-specific elongation factor